MEPPSTTFLIDEKLYLEFCALTFRSLVWRCLRWMLPAILIAILLFAFSREYGDLAMAAFVGVLAGLLVLGLQRLLLPSRGKKVYRESAALQTPQILNIDDEGFVLKQEAGVWRSKWSQMVKWDETKNLVAIYPNRVMANLIPKNQVDPLIIDIIREHLVSSGLTKRGELRK